MKPVLPTHIIIDNLPSAAPWYQLWIPIIIAFVSIMISGFSIYYTRKTFTLNSRPYIWATNYSYSANNVLIQQPSVIMLVCKAYPAKVSFRVKITLENQTLFTFSEPEQVQFPDNGQWWFGIGQTDFEKIINRPLADQALLNRIIEIDYCDLSNQKNYKSVLKQVFIPSDNQWRTIDSEAR